MPSGNNGKNWFFGGYSQEEIRLLVNSFQRIRHQKLAIGMRSFENLSKDNPEAYEIFTSNAVLPQDKSLHSEATKAHCERVVSSIEYLVRVIDNQESTTNYLRALTKRHSGHTIKAEHLVVREIC